MKYVILIHTNPAAREIWTSLSDAERAEGYRAYAALDEALAESGELIVSESLAEPTRAKRVSVQEGQVLTTDGPFAEVKEQLAGFYLVECETMERAVEIAAQVPGVEGGLGPIEVRPVQELNGMEM